MSGDCSEDEHHARFLDIYRGVRGHLRGQRRVELGAGHLSSAHQRMGMAHQACEVRTADVLVRLARNFVSWSIRDQPARAAADAPLVAAGLDRLGRAARRDARLRVSSAKLFSALIRTKSCKSNADVTTIAPQFLHVDNS